VTYLLPVVAIVLGVLVLGENITAMVLAGIALVLAGIALTRHHPESSSRALTRNALGSCQVSSARLLRASLSARKLASALVKVLPPKAVRRPRKVSLCSTFVPPSAGSA